MDRPKPWALGAAILVAVLVAWAGRNLPGDQAAVGAVFAAVVVLWATEALPLTISALLGAGLLVLVAGQDEKKVFAAFGDPLTPLFIGSFILAKAMEISGLAQRFAWAILRSPAATRSGMSLLAAVGLISVLVSLFVSNTATTAMMLPIALSLVGTLGRDSRGTPYAVAMMLMLTWGSSVAVGLPIGTPPNLIGIAMIADAGGPRLGFGPWMAFGMPITILMFLASCAVLFRAASQDAPAMDSAQSLANSAYRELGPFKPSERGVLAVFVLALVLWMLPDVAGLFGNPFGLDKRLTPAVTATLIAAALMLWPAADRPNGHVMTWQEAMRIDWGVIFLFGGGIALGQAMFGSGLAQTIGEAASRATGATDVWAITALAIAGAILLSELASNTAAANVMVPMAIGLAQAQGVSPIPPALGAAIGASFGFMLPVSTAPNAIVYSSGLVRQGQMMRWGAAIDIIGFAVTWGCLRLILPAMGLDR